MKHAKLKKKYFELMTKPITEADLKKLPINTFGLLTMPFLETGLLTTSIEEAGLMTDAPKDFGPNVLSETYANLQKQKDEEELKRQKFRFDLDFSLWLRMDYWYLIDAICLIIKENPDYYKNQDKDMLPSNALQILMVAERTIWREANGTMIKFNGLMTKIPPIVFITWAIKNEFCVPDELNCLVKKHTKKPLASSKSEIHSQYAKKRWEPHEKLLDKAGELAEQKWKSGDDAFHNEMTDFILNFKEFKPLKDSRNSLLRHLKLIGRKYGRVKGLKGSFKDKP